MDTLENISSVAFKLFESLSSPRSLTCAILLRYREIGQLVSLDIDPLHYNSPDSYHCDVVATSFFRKCRDMPSGIDTQLPAKESFFNSERQCCRTNTRFSRHIQSGPFDPSDMRVDGFLQRVKRDISSILGPLPQSLIGRFGPGATFSDRGRFVTVPDKMSTRTTVTRSSRCLLGIWGDTAWARALASNPLQIYDPLTVRGNRFTTVPKTAKTDRGICVEPSINCFFQLAVGGEIRNRLQRCGLDLKHGQDRHRLLARAASSQGHLATLDLKSASDTVSYRLVQFLLPTEWFDLLDCLRSPTTIIDGRTVVLNKFSSMGNGYTFELETLIFFSLSRTLCRFFSLDESDVTVYGDDIIIPNELAKPLISVLSYCGFEVNPSKSFYSGPFRESCGGDFFKGVAVRPFFLKELPHEPQHYIAIANGIRRTGSLCGYFDHRYHRSWHLAQSFVPAMVRACRGPEILGDLVFHDDSHYWNPRVSHGIRYFRAYVPVSRTIPLARWDCHSQFAAALYGVPSTGPILRNSVSGYRRKWVSYS